MNYTPYVIDPELDLELNREVDIVPQLIWQAWTTPELITEWFAPKPYQTPKAELELKPGGMFRTVMRSPEGDEFDGTGCFLEVIPNERLVWTSALWPGYRPQAGPMPFTAIIELQPTTTGTDYRAIAIHQSPEDCAQHASMGFVEGWGVCLDQLVELMKNR